MKISDIQPIALWRNFENLTQIPRPSKHEGKVIEYIENFAKSNHLKYIKDKVGNIIITKPSTIGFENKPTVILQAHVDMVPQKNTATVHHFETDPIKAYIDGDWVKATGTTLGADNGIGVAAALAILETKTIQHGPIEVLLTIDEETGMTGAFHLKPNLLKGTILINLDSEDEGELCIGCAGGLDASFTNKYKTEQSISTNESYRISILGLRGGHSGVDIHLERGNANCIINRLIWETSKQIDIRISSLKGGNLRNAIPREAFAIVSIPQNKFDLFKNSIETSFQHIKAELSNTEPNLKFEIEKVNNEQTVMPKTSQQKFLNLVYCIPNGVVHMSTDFEGVVETSTNLAIVSVLDGNIEIHCLLRSAVDSSKNDLANIFVALGKLSGYKTSLKGGYPGWKPNPNSSILTTMTNVYQNMYRVKPTISVIHAGLECGIIGDKYKNMDMISFGPTIKFPHSPDEKVQISSVQKFWDFLIETLKTVS